jgi:two-component system, cell cycle sensor histidine kinase and response regulator CckA
VYLPRIVGVGSSEPQKAVHVATLHRGSGVVLVVEDRANVRRLTCSMLKELGYEPLEAGGGVEALDIARRHEEPVTILLADVIMPGMKGPEVAAKLRELRPNIKAIFMSGYSDGALTESGVLDSSIVYLQKPFTLTQLADALRSVGEQ